MASEKDPNPDPKDKIGTTSLLRNRPGQEEDKRLSAAHEPSQPKAADEDAEK